VGELESAIRGKVLSPSAFANLFIGRIGQPIAAQIAATVDPEQFIELVRMTPGTDELQIITRGGQKYVREIWAEMRRALGIASGAAA
jgi:hypothetical protein